MKAGEGSRTPASREEWTSIEFKEESVSWCLPSRIKTARVFSFRIRVQLNGLRIERWNFTS